VVVGEAVWGWRRRGVGCLKRLAAGGRRREKGRGVCAELWRAVWL